MAASTPPRPTDGYGGARAAVATEGSTTAAPPWPPEGSGGASAAVATEGSGGASQGGLG